jgi:chromosome segregation ATPase
MKGVYEQLKTAYPEAEYQSLEDELKMLRNKYADQINTILELTAKLSDLQKNARQVHEQAEDHRAFMEYNEDLEKHYHYLSARLQKVDRKYWYEQ